MHAKRCSVRRAPRTCLVLVPARRERDIRRHSVRRHAARRVSRIDPVREPRHGCTAGKRSSPGRRGRLCGEPAGRTLAGARRRRAAASRRSVQPSHGARPSGDRPQLPSRLRTRKADFADANGVRSFDLPHRTSRPAGERRGNQSRGAEVALGSREREAPRLENSHEIGRGAGSAPNCARLRLSLRGASTIRTARVSIPGRVKNDRLNETLCPACRPSLIWDWLGERFAGRTVTKRKLGSPGHPGNLSWARSQKDHSSQVQELRWNQTSRHTRIFLRCPRELSQD